MPSTDGIHRQNFIILTSHGVRIVAYLQEWQTNKRLIRRFFEDLVDHLNDEEINIYELYNNRNWKETFTRERSRAIIYLLIASLLQEVIGHLLKADAIEHREMIIREQRAMLNEVLDVLLRDYGEQIDERMIALWRKANQLELPTPKHAPESSFLKHIEGLLVPA